MLLILKTCLFVLVPYPFIYDDAGEMKNVKYSIIHIAKILSNEYENLLYILELLNKKS